MRIVLLTMALAGATAPQIIAQSPTPIALRFDTCPQNDPAYNTIRADFQIRRQGAVVGTINCSQPASQMPLAAYTDELLALQALRVAYYMDQGRTNYLPWTPLRFYDWLKSKIGGINITTATTSAYCCDQFDGKLFMAIGVTLDDGNRAYKLSFNGVTSNLALFGHEARHVDGFPHTSGCGIPGGCDSTYDEANLSPYGIQYWLFRAWLNGTINLGFSCWPGSMSADTASWYLNAANGYLSRFDNTKPPPVTMPLQPGGPCLLASDRFSVLRNGVWFVDRNGNNQWDAVDASRLMFFGLPGDQAVAGDWTANGVTRAGVFRNGLWYLDLNNNGLWDGPAGGDAIFSFGLPGDTAIVGDWNGDGRTKLGVFRCPPAGVCTWVLDYAGKFAYDPGTAKVLSYGLRGDIPVANNWSGTWIADQIGVYRPLPNGLALWIVDSNGSGAWEPSDAVYQFGLATDVPVVGNWNNGTRKRLGVFRNGTWIMDANGNNAYDATDGVGFFGLPGDEPLASRWSASALNPPAQLAPADQSVFNNFPRTTVFQWTTVSAAAGYGIEVDCYHCCVQNQWCSDVGGATLINEGPTTSFIMNYYGAQPGRWRVWAIDVNGVRSNKTNWWVFTYTQ